MEFAYVLFAVPELFFDRKKYPRVLNEALLLLMFFVGNQSVLALSFVLIVTLYHSRTAVSKFVGLVLTELFLFIIHCYAYIVQISNQMFRLHLNYSIKLV